MRKRSMMEALLTRFLVIALFLGLAMPIPAQEPEYVWPTDASRIMTSSFGEYRARRFHAAIDIKTWNQTGYKVFAVRDGYIMRILVSPFGYGKALYHKLDNGEIAVYAHLERFNDEIEDFVRKEQNRNVRYRLDRYLKEEVFPVKKGDVIAYTGETGIGVPHLHFELRDAHNRPINPFLAGFKVEDSVPPTPIAVSLSPLTHGSRLNDDFEPIIMRLQANADGTYRLSEPFSFEGEVGVSVACYDMTESATNRFQVYQFDLFINGKPHFQTRYDRFSYTNARYAELEREYRLMRRGRGRFNRLYLDPENKLRLYQTYNPANGRLISQPPPPRTQPRTAGFLALDTPPAPADRAIAAWALPPGQHELTIRLQDFWGNTTIITGEFIAGRRFQITPTFTADDRHVNISAVTFPDDIAPQQLLLWQHSNPAHSQDWTLVKTLDFDDSSASQQLEAWLPVRILERDRLYANRSFRLLMRDRHGIDSWPAFLSFPAPAEAPPFQLDLATDFYDDYVRVVLNTSVPLTKKPFVELTSGDGATNYPELLQKDHATYLLALPLAAIAGKNIRLVAQAESIYGQIAAAETTFDAIAVRKGAPASFDSDDGMLRVSFWQNSLFRDLYGRVSLSRDLAQMSGEKWASSIYSVEPKDALMNDGAMIHLKYPEGVKNVRQLGVYYRVGNRWSFIDNKVDTTKREVSARVLSFEDFALRIDDIPPAVQIRTPAANEVVGRNKVIRVYAIDRESGFASEESLVLKIDGRKVVAEYDPEHGLVTYVPYTPFAPGQRTLEFTATDRCGNSTVVRRTFTVN